MWLLVAFDCVYKTRSEDKGIKQSVTSREKGDVIDDSKIRIEHKGLTREWHNSWVHCNQENIKCSSKLSTSCDQIET